MNIRSQLDSILKQAEVYKGCTDGSYNACLHFHNYFGLKKQLEDEESMEKIVLYKNRKYYNSTRKKYVNYKDMMDILLEDVRFKVIDKESDQDITLNVLNKVIGENAFLTMDDIQTVLNNRRG